MFCIPQVAQYMFRPQNAKELFNLRHAQLRNAIERIFGIMKRKFPLPTRVPEFTPQKQAKLVAAIACLFNTIRKYAPETWQLTVDQLTALDQLDDIEFAERFPAEDLFPPVTDEELGELHGEIPRAEQLAADARRDQIAEEMWIHYLEVLAECGLL